MSLIYIAKQAKKKCVHVYGVNSLVGVDFQQFLKNKMVATTNFLLTYWHFDDVRLIKGKVMNISSPNFVCGYKVP